jgi:hypothetical protein
LRKLVGRWDNHDVPNGSGILIVKADNQDTLNAYIMGLSAQCSFPITTTVMGDAYASKGVKQ